MQKAPDKRVIKTRNLIKLTVAKMLVNQKPDEINVSEIARQALIQRATFYNHYANVYEVAYDIFRDITAVVAKELERVDFSYVRGSCRDITDGFKRIRRSLEPEYIALLLSDNPAVNKGLRDWLTDSAVKRVEKCQRALTRFEKYSAAMYVNGLIDAYAAWKRDSPEGNTDDYAAYAVKVIDNACGFIGIN